MSPERRGVLVDSAYSHKAKSFAPSIASKSELSRDSFESGKDRPNLKHNVPPVPSSIVTAQDGLNA